MYGLGEYDFIRQRQQEIRREVAENRLGKMLLANREGRFRLMGDTKRELERDTRGFSSSGSASRQTKRGKELEMTTQRHEARSETRRSVLLALVLGVILAALTALAGMAQEAEATFPGANGRIAFYSERTTGTGVDNPTGDSEIFTIRPDGTGLKQLTHNTVDDSSPVFSPDGQKIAYDSMGDTASNPEGDTEIYVMNALDGSGKKNLTNNGTVVRDGTPVFSPDGKKIAYWSDGVQNSNLEGDAEVYVMNSADGSGQMNLSNNGTGVTEVYPVFSPDGQKIAYTSYGIQNSNPQGDREVYVVNALDGTGNKNLTNNGVDVADRDPAFSPGGQKIAYTSYGIQTSNLQGDDEVYVMSALDGMGKKNLTNNGVSDTDSVFSPDGKKVAYDSQGIQNSNSQGDTEIYIMSALDGTGKKNLTNNGGVINDYYPILSPDGKKVAYMTDGKQNSNSQGDEEVYVMNALDGTGKKNLTNNAEYDELSDWGRQAM